MLDTKVPCYDIPINVLYLFFIFINPITRRGLYSQIIDRKDSYFYYEAIIHSIYVLSLFLVTIKSAALVANMYLTDSTVLSKTRVQSQLLCQARPATMAAPVNLKANSVNFPRNLGADSS